MDAILYQLLKKGYVAYFKTRNWLNKTKKRKKNASHTPKITMVVNTM